MFVSISFIVLMMISLAWLVFYYIQRFRYLHAKDRLSVRFFARLFILYIISVSCYFYMDPFLVVYSSGSWRARLRKLSPKSPLEPSKTLTRYTHSLLSLSPCFINKIDRRATSLIHSIEPALKIYFRDWNLIIAWRGGISYANGIIG